MSVSVFLSVLVVVIVTPQGLSTGYQEEWRDYDYLNYYYQEEGEDPPTFLARPQTFTVEVGQSVIIPCDVDKPGGKNKVIIKKLPANGASEKLLSVGSDKVTPDQRVTVDGSRLTITNTRPRDAGAFLCQIDLEPPLQLRHTLDVQYAPTIRALVPPEQRVARGKSVTLECSTRGNPEPTIRWTRQEGPLPSGQRTHQGPRLTVEAVERHMEGTYLCTADNGIGEPASAAVSLTVEYPPEVSTERAVVRTGDGDKVELVCVVHGLPPPDVAWTRDGHPLPDNLMDTKLHLPHQQQQQQQEHHQTRQHHQLLPSGHSAAAYYDPHVSQSHFPHRHTLTIAHVTEKDFGAYVCIAENIHGQMNGVIQMTGLPKPPQVTSSPIGGESHRYTLTWETESYYPITEFLIKYRKTHLGAWHMNRTLMMAGSWLKVSQTVGEAEVRQQGSRLLLACHLQGLEVASDYVAVVRVRNKYGWSAESDSFSFSTRKALKVLQSTSRASPLATALCVSVLLAALCLTLM
ncbi:protein amalgam isoform X1 [Procambarus clarkii]|uniref:protein amalgam isoform X1 n=1 Tax=Procambarus clarkii TaxID=6728 RepID=UPI0037428126